MRLKRAPIVFDSRLGALGQSGGPYNWLPMPYCVTTKIIDYGDSSSTSKSHALCTSRPDGPPMMKDDWGIAVDVTGTKTYGDDGVGVIQKWWYLQDGMPLSYNAWAVSKLAQQWPNPAYQNPNFYDWVILGEYAMPGRRQFLFSILNTAAQSAGLPAGYDWTDDLASASADYWNATGDLFRWLETPAVHPVHGALAHAAQKYPALAPFVEQTAPGSEIYEQSAIESRARRDAHKAVSSSLKTMFWSGALAFGAAAVLAPAAGTSTAAGAAEGAAAAGELTAAEWSAGLTAEQIGGGALAELGAGLTAAEWEAVAAGWEGLAAESSLQNVALAEIAGDVSMGTLGKMIGDEAAAEMLAQGATILGPQSAAASTWYADAGKAVADKLIATGKAQLASELQQEFMQAVAGEPESVPTSGAEYDPYAAYGPGGEFDLSGEGASQPGALSVTMKKAAPYALGAGLALAAIFAFAEERN